DEAEFQRLDAAEDALAPPAVQVAGVVGAQVEAVAERREARVEQLERLVELLLQDADGVRNAVAVAEQERLGQGVAAEEARRLAAAVEAEVERVERPVLAGVKGLGAVLLEVGFAELQEVRTDAAALVRGPYADGA